MVGVVDSRVWSNDLKVIFRQSSPCSISGVNSTISSTSSRFSALEPASVMDHVLAVDSEDWSNPFRPLKWSNRGPSTILERKSERSWMISSAILSVGIIRQPDSISTPKPFNSPIPIPVSCFSTMPEDCRSCMEDFPSSAFESQVHRRASNNPSSSAVFPSGPRAHFLVIFSSISANPASTKPRAAPAA